MLTENIFLGRLGQLMPFNLTSFNRLPMKPNLHLPFLLGAILLMFSCRREDEIKFTSGLNARLQSSCGPEDRVELLAKCKDMVRRKYNVAIYHLHGTSIPTGLSLCPVHEDIVEAIIASLPKGKRMTKV